MPEGFKACPEVHAIAGGYDSKYCNARSVRLNKASLTLKAGKSKTLRALVTGVKTDRSRLEHVKLVRWYSSDRSVAKVNGDGIITPVSGGTAIITTTITGRYDDTTSKETDVLKIKTTVDIPSSISQVPIITNVKVPARANEQNGEVEIDWYALNKSNKSDNRMTTSGLFYTI